MGVVASQYEVWLVELDPTRGHEIQKTRPCLVISPNEMNHRISTVIVAPMTTKTHPYPSRIPLVFKNTQGWVVLDQLRTVDRMRLVLKLGTIEKATFCSINAVLREMLVD